VSNRNVQRLLLALGVLLALLIVTLPAYAASMELRKEVESNLICQCGCTMVVVDCQCEWAENARVDIAGKLDQGMSVKEVIASYVDIYGTKVLAAPPKSGFHWTVWVTPFLSLAAGGGLLYLLLKRWVKSYNRDRYRKKDGTGDSLRPEDRVRYEKKIEEELKKYF